MRGVERRREVRRKDMLGGLRCLELELRLAMFLRQADVEVDWKFGAPHDWTSKLRHLHLEARSTRDLATLHQRHFRYNQRSESNKAVCVLVKAIEKLSVLKRMSFWLYVMILRK